MGCCSSDYENWNAQGIPLEKHNEKIRGVGKISHNSSSAFEDISLTSEDSQIKDWTDFKSTTFDTESTSQFSIKNYSTKKIKTFSNYSTRPSILNSIEESFYRSNLKFSP